MNQIPDAPWIREAETYGVPPYDEPDTRCPVCGQDCETIYTDQAGNALGCDMCILRCDAAEWNDEQRRLEE